MGSMGSKYADPRVGYGYKGFGGALPTSGIILQSGEHSPVVMNSDTGMVHQQVFPEYAYNYFGY